MSTYYIDTEVGQAIFIMCSFIFLLFFQAIQRAGVRPRTSVDALNADVQRNTVALQDALQSSIRDALARRLTEETVDFDKDRFPHAHRITKPK